MSRGPDVGTLLCRAIEHEAARNGCNAQVVSANWDRWASATFAGAQHELTLRATPCPALDAWLATLPDADLPLRGHFVAELLVAGVRCTGGEVVVVVEALSVEA